MDIKDCVKKSVYITTEYYNNHTEPYFDQMADNAIWYGPAIGQVIFGVEKMREAWKLSPNNLTFSIGDIEVHSIRTSPYSCEVMLMFVVTTHYPNGDTIPLLQRIQFSWADIRSKDKQASNNHVSKIFMVHISNPIEQHKDDFIYPIHYNEVYKNSNKTVQEPRISLRGEDNSFHVLSISSIIWAESTLDQHCLVHLRNKTIKVKTTVSEIEKLTRGFLVRVHSGYIVNPKDVVSIWRFRVSLSDGSVIPIPEKKYTAVKAQLLKE